MRTLLISTILLDLCAASMVYPMNADKTVTTGRGVWSDSPIVLAPEQRAADFNLSLSWMQGDPAESASARVYASPAAGPSTGGRTRIAEPSAALIVLAALLSFGLAAAIRSAPDVWRWFKRDRPRMRRRRVKVEIRMMA